MKAEVVVEKPASEVAPQPDILTRVAGFKQEPKAPDSTPSDDVNFDYKQLENIKDPEAKSWADKAYKSMQSGFTKKFNELAELRKSVEAQKQQVTKWTPERIQQELLNNPEFVQAASVVANSANQNPQDSGLTDEQYSALSDREKAKLSALEQQVIQLQQINNNVLRNKEDSELSSKYPDYSAQEIDTITADMLAGKLQATREHLYKAFKYEDNVRKAYELGKQDALKENQDKARAVSVSGLNVNSGSDVPKQQPGQSREGHFAQIALANLAKMGGALRK